MRLFYWDLDGTLLTTARAGVPALEDGVESATGVRPDLSDRHTAGLTDRMIVREILGDLGLAGGPDVETAVLEAYAARLPERLQEKRGRVLPGVHEALSELHGRDDVRNVLLTGNVRAGAAAKLRAYGLAEYFDDGGFGDDGFDRVDIARRLLARMDDELGVDVARRGLVVGDTPLDVACARTMGLRVLGVATGGYSKDELAASGAWRAVEQLPDPEELLSLHDEPARLPA